MERDPVPATTTGSVVAVVVLGDIVRSPRTSYHALSLARRGHAVHLIGYVDSTLPDTLLQQQRDGRISIHAFPVFGAAPPGLFLLWAPIKALLQLLALVWILCFAIPAPSHILVQNPPSIPTLIVAQFAVWARSSRLVIDWHNLGYSILALRLGHTSLLVKLAKWIERTFGRIAHAHLFVTQAMRDHLVAEWDLVGEPIVLYDRPPAHFRRLSGFEKSKMATATIPSLASFDAAKDCLIVSSTSWTVDEDFDLFLEALSAVDLHLQSSRAAAVCKVHVVITGKGPLRDHYEAEIADRTWSHVLISTAWLAAEDYPKLLGVADIGVSLHTSSSGLDLPMKVVDMFGCGLAVCAYDFECLSELVKPSFGRVFTAAEELVSNLLVRGAPFLS
ncbi:hypothetical protein BC828DRAFT_22297 [Blastocladiella britannica]|nr:hypothetical protein BC828DRAFT_22297 [Blastocladiella britannica]